MDALEKFMMEGLKKKYGAFPQELGVLEEFIKELSQKYGLLPQGHMYGLRYFAEKQYNNLRKEPTIFSEEDTISLVKLFMESNYNYLSKHKKINFWSHPLGRIDTQEC